MTNHFKDQMLKPVFCVRYISITFFENSSSIYFNLLQLVLSTCVAAVKCRPELHHCVVISFWSSEIMECMLFAFVLKIEFRLCARGASVVWHLLLPLMNSFNKTEIAIFHCRLCFRLLHKNANKFPYMILMTATYQYVLISGVRRCS